MNAEPSVYEPIKLLILAEKEGFEPSDESPRRRFSRPVHSTALPLLQAVYSVCWHPGLQARSALCIDDHLSAALPIFIGTKPGVRIFSLRDALAKIYTFGLRLPGHRSGGGIRGLRPAWPEQSPDPLHTSEPVVPTGIKVAE